MTVRERPILFSAPMVRAILAGTKTVTRRIINLHLGERGCTVHTRTDGSRYVEQIGSSPQNPGRMIASPYGEKGDRLWVKETIRRAPSSGAGRDYAFYAADEEWTKLDAWPWKRSVLPAIHCPRGLSRIDLDVAGVRVERLQEITEEDAIREGVGITESQDGIERDARENFALLWDELNAARAPWSSNPFVWRVEFKRVKP